MTTKTTLLAATAIAAMAFAGAANAGTLTANINGAGVVTAAAPYTIAKERNDAADAIGANSSLILAFTTAQAYTAAQARDYDITITTAGGGALAGNPTITAQTSAGAAAVSAVTLTAQTATSRTYRLTVTKDGTAGNLTGFTFAYAAGDITSAASETDISFATAVNEVTGSTLVGTVDATAATTLIAYKNAVVDLVTVSRAALAALPDFKTFKAITGLPAANTATVSTPLLVDNLASYSVSTLGTTTFYAGLSTPTTVTRDGIVQTATVVITGNALASTTITPTLTVNGGATPTGTRSGSSVTYALNAANADSFSTAATLSVAQTATAANQLAIPASLFSVSWLPTYAAGFTAPTSAIVKNAGEILLDGTNFIAPWFSGSQAQTQSQVRLTNFGTQNANVRISIANGVFNFNGSPTAFNDTACSTVFVLPVAGDLVIGQSQLTACFGAFLRGDVLITVEGAAADITAKMRNTSAQGNFETTLGRASGSSVAAAQ